jgi:hypothetical protein
MNTERPALRFVFSEDAGEKFFRRVEIPAGESGPKVLDAWEDMKRSRRKPLRALCIFLLLAKHRYELWKRKIPIRFDDMATREQIKKDGDLTWIYSLAVLFKEWQQETNQFARTSGNQSKVDALFCNELFFRAMLRRPVKYETDAVGETYAEYDISRMALERLEFVTVGAGSPKDLGKLEGESLAEFAEKLEVYEVMNRKRALKSGKQRVKEGWIPLVKRLVAETRDETPVADAEEVKSPERKVPLSVLLQSSFEECQRLEGEVGKALADRMQNPRGLEKWYILSLNPVISDSLIGHIRAAVRDYSVQVEWAYQANPTKKSVGIETQWKANLAGYQSLQDFKSKYFLDKGRVTLWFHKIYGSDKNVYRERIKFYESTMVHHFTAILFAPSDFFENFYSELPPDFACYVVPLAMHRMEMEPRCGLFLEGPSALAKFYYHAIRGFFEVGVQQGHLKPFDPWDWIESLSHKQKSSTRSKRK